MEEEKKKMNTKAEMMKYVEEHQIRSHLNNLLNLTLRELPADPLRHLANLFEAQASSLKGILAANVSEGFDPLGRPAVVVEVSTARSSFSAKITCSNRTDPGFWNMVMDGGLLNTKEITAGRVQNKTLSKEEEKERDNKLSESMSDLAAAGQEDQDRLGVVCSFMREKIIPSVLGKSPANQQEIDAQIQSLLQAKIDQIRKRQRLQKIKADKQSRLALKAEGLTKSKGKGNATAGDRDEGDYSSMGDAAGDYSADDGDGPGGAESKDDDNVPHKAHNKKFEEDHADSEQKDLPIVGMLTHACFALSSAICRAAAADAGKALYRHIADVSGSRDELYMPLPAIEILAGGDESRNYLPCSSIQILPIGATSFVDAMQIGLKVKRAMSRQLMAGGGYWGVALTGAAEVFSITDISEGLELVGAAVRAAGVADQVKIGVSVSANAYFRPPTATDIAQEKNLSGTYEMGYKIANDLGEHTMDTEEITELYRQIIEKHNVVVIEDPFEAHAWEFHAELTEEFGREVQVLGRTMFEAGKMSDLLQRAVREKSCNGVCLQLSSVATVSEAIAVAKQVQREGWGLAIGAVPGATTDTFIADLAMGLRIRQVKMGGLECGEAMAKYSRLLHIEAELGKGTEYVGDRFKRSG